MIGHDETRGPALHEQARIVGVEHALHPYRQRRRAEQRVEIVPTGRARHHAAQQYAFARRRGDVRRGGIGCEIGGNAVRRHISGTLGGEARRLQGRIERHNDGAIAGRRGAADEVGIGGPVRLKVELEPAFGSFAASDFLECQR